ncbi:MAG: glycosyltransferase family 2 protein [Patescibacteria group bacterium]
MKSSISVIILTFNEEENLEKCLKSITGLAQEIFIVDSHSTDRTLEIAKKYSAQVYAHDFKNQADQFNWGLDNLAITSDWILKLDADEEILPELKDEILEFLPKAGKEISGFYMKRRFYFMGRWIKHGGYYPIWFLRLWRKGKGRSEERKMDEHIILLEDESRRLNNDFIDNNKKDLKNWILKHKNYASREAEEVKAGEYGMGEKRNFYYQLPPFLRVFCYFIYRYFFRLGFLDGKAGFIFHFLHGFWYRFLVDAKIYGLSGI